MRVIGWSFQTSDHRYRCYRWDAVASLTTYDIFHLPPLRGLQVSEPP